MSRSLLSRLAPLLLGAVVAPMLAGCGLSVHNLNFRVDSRLEFVSPPSQSLVSEPFTVRWHMSGFRVAAPGTEAPGPGAGYFAVFVDREPIRPNQTMRVIATGDPTCLKRPGCPDTPYLQARQIYTTTAESLTLGPISPITGNLERTQTHMVIVVLMDTSGHRIGESAWELDLRMKNPGAGL